MVCGRYLWFVLYFMEKKKRVKKKNWWLLWHWQLASFLLWFCAGCFVALCEFPHTASFNFLPLLLWSICKQKERSFSFHWILLGIFFLNFKIWNLGCLISNFKWFLLESLFQILDLVFFCLLVFLSPFPIEIKFILLLTSLGAAMIFSFFILCCNKYYYSLKKYNSEYRVSVLDINALYAPSTSFVVYFLSWKHSVDLFFQQFLSS